MTCFHGNEAKRFFFEKKNSKWPTKIRPLSRIINSQYFFVKILWIGPWVSRIDWCKGHWCGSTYMVVRLSSISPTLIHSIDPWTTCSRVRSNRVKSCSLKKKRKADCLESLFKLQLFKKIKSHLVDGHHVTTKVRLLFWHYFVISPELELTLTLNRYRTCAIITRGLYIFYPIFQCSL